MGYNIQSFTKIKEKKQRHLLSRKGVTNVVRCIKKNYYELLRIMKYLYSQYLSANCRDIEAAEICSQDF
jgi:hypothetical protein